MAEMNVELLREKLHKAARALFCISEVCVDVSKQHISAERAIDKIRNYLYDTDVIGSRYRVDQLIEECMEPVVSNMNDEFERKYLGKWIGLEPLDINYPDCCDGCGNNPKNGGSGICNCTLPYMQNPTTYTVPSGDACMAKNTGGYVCSVSTGILNGPRDNTLRVDEAVERTKKYIKE